ncbi:hypothetical protein HC891_03245 [Candidatus Gracilibacteria bacterium]|nr:hypothetical protein [Candidatus Gracilibacteria bacterium]
MLTDELAIWLHDLALQTAGGPRWLLAGDAALLALGVEGISLPKELTLVCSGEDGGQLQALLPAEAAIRIAPDPQLRFDGSSGALDLAAAWRHRSRFTIDGQTIAVLPLEYLLLSYLSTGDQQVAERIAGHLHQRGFDYAVIEDQIATIPALEQAMVDVMQKVVPLARRAARRRAIRAAERKELEWFTRKSKPGDE